MRIKIIGGGPAGLLFAMLMKKHDVGHEVTVFEQNPADATYGWGVVFSDVALGFIRDVDPAFFAEFTRNHARCDRMEVIHRGTAVPIRGNGFSRVARIELLRVMQDNCRRVGVELRFGERIDDVAAVGPADLIVASDGINSPIRESLRDHFEPAVETRRNRFAWYGTTHLFDAVTLIFRPDRAGTFIAHSYQYSPGLSTFLVECSPETWEAAGLDHATDEESRAYCEAVFAADLHGAPLLSKRSDWFLANIVSNRRWSKDHIVLLGDALRSVHFSLGSGTRMAMQDAIALFHAMKGGAGVAQGLAAFEADRRPKSERFQDAAARSLDWYETVDSRMGLPPIAFAYDYMTRTGQVGAERRRHEELDHRRRAVHGGGDPDEAVL
ncbi:MAG: FAD-dependent monooxygenase, partial [Gemmatimonadaceae bacterium]|nr:FAD-dependent monooxygenase [Acetobacteraceae bacterium]